MSNRTISSYIDQRTLQLSGPRVRRFRARIRKVLFAGHSFVVTAPGYTGPAEVPADPLVSFGTPSRPLVVEGDDAWIEMDDTGLWRAVQYLANKRCYPATAAVVPNVPLPDYNPPIDSNIGNGGFGGWSPIDLSFPPLSIPMGQLPSAKMPASSYNVYDIADGILGNVGAGRTKEMLFILTPRAIKVVSFHIYCAESAVQVTVTIGADLYASISAERVAGDWTIDRFNGTTGTNIATYAGGSADTASTSFGTNFLSVPANTLINVTLITSIAITGIAYAMGGRLA